MFAVVFKSFQLSFAVVQRSLDGLVNMVWQTVVKMFIGQCSLLGGTALCDHKQNHLTSKSSQGLEERLLGQLQMKF